MLESPPDSSVESPFARHLTRVSSFHLHWAEVGAGPVVVLLHGLCDSHRTWAAVAPALARSRRVLMPDLPGHGLSERPDALYTVEWYADVVRAWLDAIGVTSFDVVGHSFGGGVAQMLLLSSGDRIGRLALVAPGGLGREVSLGLRLWSAANPSDRLTQPLLPPSTRFGMSAMLPRATPEEIGYLAWQNAMPGTARSLSRTVRNAVDWRGQRETFFDRAHELARIPPIRLFWGDKDPIVPFGHAGEMMRRLDGVELVRFARCGHFPHQEHAAEFTAALDAFLELPVSEEPARLPEPPRPFLLPPHVELASSTPPHGAAAHVDLIAPPPLAWWQVAFAWAMRLVLWLAARVRPVRPLEPRA